jgi:translocator assembly and maintenance protein 41
MAAARAKTVAAAAASAAAPRKPAKQPKQREQKPRQNWEQDKSYFSHQSRQMHNLEAIKHQSRAERIAATLCGEDNSSSDTKSGALAPDIEFCMAYGSAVFSTDKWPALQFSHKVQARFHERKRRRNVDAASSLAEAVDADQTLPMIDFVVAVDDPLSWHRDNIERNPSHYWWPLRLNRGVTQCVLAWLYARGAGIFYNTLVPWPAEQCTIKYGVIATERLCRDLEHWDDLYVAGRLHKPALVTRSTPRVTELMRANHTHAFSAALLAQPADVNLNTLFEHVAAFSYAGDVRMRAAEDPHKTLKLVQANFSAFDDTYLAQRTEELTELHADFGATNGAVLARTTMHGRPLWFNQKTSVASRVQRLRRLPRAVRRYLKEEASLSASASSSSAATASCWATRLAKMHPAVRLERLNAALARIVRRSSAQQTVNGFFSAGFIKSATYVCRKVLKRIAGSKLKK